MRRKNLAYNADGTPRYVRLYDNFGKTLDRYTCVFTRRRGEGFPYLAMSGRPFSPLGVGQHGEGGYAPIDRPRYSHIGKRVVWDELPKDVQRCIMQDYVAYWGEAPQEGDE